MNKINGGEVYSALKEEEHNSPVPKYGLPKWLPSMRTVCKGKEKTNFKWKNLLNATWAMLASSMSTVKSHVDCMIWWEWYFIYLCDSLSNTHNPRVIMRKHQKNPNWVKLYKILSILLKTVKTIKNQKSEKLSQARGAWGDMTTKCNVAWWVESWKRKRSLEKNWHNLNKYGL